MLPLRVMPMNNPIMLISQAQATFFAADSICVALQISEQFSLKARMQNPLDADLGPDFNAE